MSESDGETTPSGIDDDQLPDDLVAGDDNPLAEPLPAGESVGELLEDGKPADESADSSGSSDEAPESDASQDG